MFILEDGKGTGNKAQVNEDNQLETHAISVTDASYAASTGNCYACATNFLSLTTTGAWHGIWYIKNDNTHEYHLEFIRVSANAGIVQWKLMKNPSTGTLISAGTLVEPENANFKEQNDAGITFKVGGEGKTLTDGTHFSQLQYPSGSDRFDINGTVTLGPGDTIALMAKPSAACDVGSTVFIYKHEHE